MHKILKNLILATILSLSLISTAIADSNQDAFNTLSLLGHDAARINVTRVEQGGTVDQRLADVLNSKNHRGKKLKDGVYAPSELERKLHAIFQADPGFAKLSFSLDPDKVENAQANASFTLDYSRTTETEIEFIPGKIRRSYFIEIGVGFTLLDRFGRTVFATEVADYDVVHCFIEQQSTCIDNLTNDVFSLNIYWQNLLKKTTQQAVERVSSGLRQWDSVLKHMTARIILNKAGEKLKLLKNAEYTRYHNLADHPYLFLTIQAASIKKLLNGMAKRGIELNAAEQARLGGFSTTLFRHHLDASLRRQHNNASSSRDAGIFIIPEHGSAWFNDAMTRIVADAVNAEKFNIVTDKNGVLKKQLIESARNYGSLCKRNDTIRNVDQCLEIRVMVRDGQTQTSDASQGEVETAVQQSPVAAMLVDPAVNAKEDVNYTRLYPHSIKSPANRILTAAEQSPEYYRFTHQSAAQNDDATYLKIASFKAMLKLSEEMASSVIQTFREEL